MKTDPIDEGEQLATKFSNQSHITFSGQPIPAARPRKGKHGFYNPQSDLITKAKWEVVSQKENWHRMEGAVSINVLFKMKIPKSLSESKRKSLEGRAHIQKPDTDNLVKFVKDVLSGLVYDDDRTVADLHAKKVWSETPATIVEVSNYEE
jgi:Holliday junction resolvase RusA-like endonuclease